VTSYTPEGFRIDGCRSCTAPIVWATTGGGKRMPVDAEPVADGNVELSPVNGNPVATVLDAPSLIPGALRRSHFVTCPDAGAWRQT
jgi:hypothetical protein